MCVCKKFKKSMEKLLFNYIPITSFKLFPKIQTQYLYSEKDKMIEGIRRYESWCEVNYDQYLKYEYYDNIKCCHIVFKKKNKSDYDDVIPDCVTKPGKFFCCSVFLNN